MWRQCDTFFYAYEFYKTGINLLTPSVCWMGGYKILALEFPVVSGIIAVFFKIFGEQIYISKLVCLLFFSASVIYLYSLIKLLFYKRLAYLISVVYACLPLGLYYSTTVIIDFAELFFVFATFYYFILWLNNPGKKYLILVLFFSTLALLTKAPYILLIIFPAVYEIYKKDKIKLFLKYLIIFVMPVIIFGVWQSYVQNLNSRSPDWYFIPGYFKFNDMSSWYFGNISSRFDIDNWKNLFTRFIEADMSYVGTILFVSGILIKQPGKYNKKFFGLFCLGSVLYLLIFFNLNLIHEYYQIPLLCIASFYIAITFDYLISNMQTKKSKSFLIIIFIFFFINCIWFTERWYYKIDKLKQAASEIIKNNTNENSLVIVSDSKTDPRDPTVLAPSLRCGWSVNSKDLSLEIIDGLKKEGAEYLLIILKSGEKDSYNNFKLIAEQSFENKWEIKFYELAPTRE
jgi:Dolichyl-phosphate-mannose-protein mannosyltransferase